MLKTALEQQIERGRMTKNNPLQLIVIDPVGGQAERAWQTDVSPTLKATHYKFPPTIMMSAGFKPGQGAKARGEECRDGGLNEQTPCVIQGQTIDVEMEVAVRKHEVDTKRLMSVLREHKGAMKIKDIAEKLGLPETNVSHWFRTDRCFSIPDSEVWYPLKNCWA